MEQTIGNLGEEIRLHADPYANLSQRIIKWAHVNVEDALVQHMLPSRYGGALPNSW